MKRRHYVSFNIPWEEGERIRGLLARIECAQWWQSAPNERGLPSFENIFDAEDSRLQAVLDLVHLEGLRPFERIEHVYTDAELLTYPLLNFGVNRKPIESGGVEYGTVYDLSKACPHCGTGAVQTSPLMLRRAELPKKGLLCETCIGQKLVSTKIADVLKSSGLSGLELRQACSYRDKEPLPWWQMIARYVMTRISSRSESLIRDTEPLFRATDPKWGCTVCERDMYATKGGLPLDIVYERNQVDPEQLPDVVQTWECFGRSVLRDDPERGLQMGFAQPLLLVKPKVFDLFRKRKVRGAGFSPVRIIED